MAGTRLSLWPLSDYKFIELEVMMRRKEVQILSNVGKLSGHNPTLQTLPPGHGMCVSEEGIS